ncbi:MAG: sigma-70 family RNA polymerase sigma factor [Planctomycetota bacterium]
MSQPPPVQLESLLAYEPFVRRVLRQMMVGEDQVSDLVQETWLRALNRPPQEGRPVRAWLATVARNLARDLHRNRHRSVRREQEVAREECDDSLQRAQDRLELQQHLVQAVLGLEEPLKQVMLLSFYEELTSAQVATRLGLSESSVRRARKQALERLRGNLDESVDGGRGADGDRHALGAAEGGGRETGGGGHGAPLPALRLGSLVCFGRSRRAGVVAGPRQSAVLLGGVLRAGACARPAVCNRPHRSERGTRARSSDLGGQRRCHGPRLPRACFTARACHLHRARTRRRRTRARHGRMGICALVPRPGGFASIEALRAMEDIARFPGHFFPYTRFRSEVRRTDAEGYVDLPLTGPSIVVMGQDGQRGFLEAVPDARAVQGEGRSLTVQARGDVPMEVRVLDPDGRPLAGAPVALLRVPVTNGTQRGVETLADLGVTRVGGAGLEFRRIPGLMQADPDQEYVWRAELRIPGVPFVAVDMEADGPTVLHAPATAMLRVHLARPLKERQGVLRVEERDVDTPWSLSAPLDADAERSGFLIRVGLGQRFTVTFDDYGRGEGPSWSGTGPNEPGTVQPVYLGVLEPARVRGILTLPETGAAPPALPFRLMALGVRGKVLAQLTVVPDADGAFSVALPGATEPELLGYELLADWKVGEAWRQYRAAIAIDPHAGVREWDLGEVRLGTQPWALTGMCSDGRGIPVAGLSVEAVDSEGTVLARDTTRESGEFQMRALWSEQVFVRVAPASGWYATDEQQAVPDFQDRQVSVLPYGSLQGTVIVPEGLDSPVVQLESEQPGWQSLLPWTCEVDETGRFAFPQLRAGSYRLRIEDGSGVRVELPGLRVGAGETCPDARLQGVHLEGSNPSAAPR